MGLRGGARGHYTGGVGEIRNGQPARCVVWTVGSGPVPPVLERVLVRRGLTPVAVGSGYAALAELCLAERAGVRSVLILCGTGEVQRVLGAVERFAPSSVVWVFEPGANPPLRALVEKRDERRPAVSGQAPGADSGVGSAGAPAAGREDTPPGRGPGAPGKTMDPLMRLVRENGVKSPPRAADRVPREAAVSARDILDDAELEMLLAGERPMEERPR